MKSFKNLILSCSQKYKDFKDHLLYAPIEKIRSVSSPSLFGLFFCWRDICYWLTTIWYHCNWNSFSMVTMATHTNLLHYLLIQTILKDSWCKSFSSWTMNDLQSVKLIKWFLIFNWVYHNARVCDGNGQIWSDIK